MYAFFRDRWDGWSGSTDIGSGQKLKRLIEVEHDTPGITAAEVLGILASLSTRAIFKGVPHPVYGAALCTSIDYQPSPDDPCFGTVEVDYQEATPFYGAGQIYPGGTPGGSSSGSPTSQQPKPEDRPPTLKVTFRRVDTYPVKDLDGFPFQNVVGDRFDNPPAVPRAAMLITFTTCKAADAWNAAVGQAFFNKVNSDAWQGFAAGTCAVVGLDAALKADGAYLFWELNWTIEAGEQSCLIYSNAEPAAGFYAYADYVRIPQYGYYAYTTASTPATKAEIQVGGKPLASPAKLNADGTVRAANLNPIVDDFRVRDRIAFAGL